MLKKTLLIAISMITFVFKTHGQATIVYSNIPPSLTVNVAIPGSLSPNVSGAGAPFSITPDIHAKTGLSFSTSNGAITGTPTTADNSSYTVTVKKPDGSTISTSITIKVVNPTPPVVTYPTKESFNVNFDIELRPLASGTPVTNYSIEPGTPALPSALHLDPTSGYISGKSAVAVPEVTYTIRATSGPVYSTAKLSITINNPDAPSITYGRYNTLTVGIASTIAPTISDGDFVSYSITPNIHEITGLDFDTAHGIIRGVPNKATAPINYTVKGLVAAGNPRYTTVIVKVNNAKPAALYSPSVGHFYIDSTINPMRPISDADTSNTLYTISRKLPKGLILDRNTGAITGTPQTAIADDESLKPYIITEHYLGRTTEYTIYIDVTGYPDYVAKPATISFVGQGDIQQSLNNKSKIAANTGIGVVFRQNSSRRYGILHDIEINFSINVASTVDTIRSINDKVTNKVTNQTDFGNSALLPLNSGQAFSFSFKGFFSERGGPRGVGNYMRNAPPRSILGVLSGFYVSVSGSNRNWEYDSVAMVNQVEKVIPTSVKSSLLSFYIGPFFEFVTPKKSNNYGQNSSITLGVGYSARLILGDVQQGNNTSFRTKLLGEDSKKYYSGPEVMLALRFYSIKAEVHLPIFSNKHAAPGLSGTHLTTFIGFSGGFPLDLTKPNNQ